MLILCSKNTSPYTSATNGFINQVKNMEDLINFKQTKVSNGRLNTPQTDMLDNHPDMCSVSLPKTDLLDKHPDMCEVSLLTTG